MKIGLVPEGPLAFVNGKYYYTEGEIQYIDKIANQFDELTIYGYAVKKGDQYFDVLARVEITNPKIKVRELPHLSGKIGKLYQMWLVFLIFLKEVKNQDLFYIFYPGYPAVFSYLACRIKKVSYFSYLASDWPEEADLLNPWRGLFGKIIFPFFYKGVSWAQDSAVKNSVFTLTAGGMIKAKYDNTFDKVYETVPRLNWEDFNIYKREDTCESSEINLLFVGYLLPRKGLLYLLKALKLIKNDLPGKKFMLHIAGDGEQREEVESFIRDNDLGNEVVMYGHVANGPDVIDMYQNADIFVVPSYAGEGFPRVLYEGMFYTLPIVTCNICGIPYKLTHEENCLMVKPESEAAILSSLKRIIVDGELRRKLIQGSYSFSDDLLRNSDGGKQIKDLLIKYNVV